MEKEVRVLFLVPVARPLFSRLPLRKSLLARLVLLGNQLLV